MRDRDSLPYRCSMQANSTSSDAFGRNQDRTRVESWYSSFPFNSTGKRGRERERNFWTKLHIYVCTCIRWKEKRKKMCTRSKMLHYRYAGSGTTKADESRYFEYNSIIISTREERIRIAGNERVSTCVANYKLLPTFQNSFPFPRLQKLTINEEDRSKNYHLN